MEIKNIKSADRVKHEIEKKDNHVDHGLSQGRKFENFSSDE